MVKALKSRAVEKGTSESEVLRNIIDVYLKNINELQLSCEPYKKIPPADLKVLPRTIAKEQNTRLRELSEKTGRNVSELIREAVEGFRY